MAIELFTAYWSFLFGIACLSIAFVFAANIRCFVAENNYLCLFSLASCLLALLPAVYFNCIPPLHGESVSCDILNSDGFFLRLYALTQLAALITYSWLLYESVLPESKTLHISTAKQLCLSLVVLFGCLITGGTLTTSIVTFFIVIALFIYLSITTFKATQFKNTLGVTAFCLIQLGLICWVLLLQWAYYTQNLHAADFFLYKAFILLTGVNVVIIFILNKVEKNKLSEQGEIFNLEKKAQEIATLSPFTKSKRHTLRAPLTDILGLAELIADDPLNNNQRIRLSDIQRSARRALATINSLFSYSQNALVSSNKHTKFVSEHFNINDLLVDCIQFFSPAHIEGQRDYIINSDEEFSTPIIGDQEKIRRAFLLIVEYLASAKNIDEIRIDLLLRAPNTLTAEFNVPDNLAIKSGKSLPDSLQVARQLAEQLGGTLKLDQRDQTLQLNILFEAFDEEHASALSNTLLKGKRVLVLDDNPTSCQVICAYLERWCIASSHATNSVDAKALLRHHENLQTPFDLMIVDYLLTESTGVEFIADITQDSNLSVKPCFIVMSNSIYLLDDRTLKNLGVLQSLEKPVLAETLHRVLLKAFHLSASIAAIDSPLFQQNNKTTQHRVLLVEDNLVSATVTGSQIADLGLIYDHATTGAEAIHLFQTNHYALVLLDCELPDMSGLEVAKSLRATTASNQRNQHYTIA